MTEATATLTGDGSPTEDESGAESHPELRAEVRAWLAVNLPEGWTEDPASVPPAQRDALALSWGDRLAQGRWLGQTWPKEYGARGLSAEEAAVVTEEFARAHAPLRPDSLGEVLVGPTVLAWGTDDQKARFVPGIVSGEEIWCQGFSEPDAGSDLASLRTRAAIDGDELVITGQKIWTSLADEADHIFMLVRTDPDAPPHKGISFVLVPMKQPGIETRPIIRLDGSDEFSEVFFDGARAPLANVLGKVNEGWKVAVSGLGLERGTSATTSHFRFAAELDGILEEAVATGASADPRLRQLLAWAWSKVLILRVHESRIDGADTLGRTAEADALASLNKLMWSEYHQVITNAWMDMAGADGMILGGLAEGTVMIPGAGVAISTERYPLDPRQAAFLYARSETIWGGTSQVQRNIIAERTLGLPREPR